MKLFRKGDGPLDRLGRGLELQAIRLSLLAVHALPERLALGAGRTAGRAAAMALPRYRHRAEEQLRLAFPGKPESWIEKTAVACFEHFGQAAAEMIKGPRSSQGNRWEKIVRVKEEARLLEVVNSGKGAILASGHIGNWELAAQWFFKHGAKLVSIAHGSRNRGIDEMMLRERRARGHSTVDVDGAFRNLVRELRGGAMVAVLTDRNPRDQGMIVPFFGRDILTVTSPALLSHMTGSPILPWACIRDGRAFRYTVHLGDLLVPDRKAPRDAEVARLTRESTAWLERFIRMAPEQWQWMHRRWKITPGGLKRAGIAKPT